jgi:hypothetical protein
MFAEFAGIDGCPLIAQIYVCSGQQPAPCPTETFLNPFPALSQAFARFSGTIQRGSPTGGDIQPDKRSQIFPSEFSGNSAFRND